MKAITYKDETMGADYVVSEIPAEYKDEAHQYREQLIEKVSESNDALLEKYLHGQELTEAEIKQALRKRAIDQSGRKRRRSFGDAAGVRTKASTDARPVVDICRRGRIPRSGPRSEQGRDAVERPASDAAPFAALAFKLMTDPFVGQLTFIRATRAIMRGRRSITRRKQPSASAAS